MKNILQEFNILNAKPKKDISTTDKAIEKIIIEEKDVIKGLSKSSEITVKSKDDKEIEGYLSHVINERIDFFLDIRDKINLDCELSRLNKNLEDKEKYINGLRKKNSNKEYQKRAFMSLLFSFLAFLFCSCFNLF